MADKSGLDESSPYNRGEKLKKKKIKIVFAGYSGENNTGAESRIVTVVKDVKASLGDLVEVQITVPTLSKKNIRRYLKDEDVKIIEMGWIGKFILNMLRMVIQWNDILILVEGASFTDHFSSVFIFIFLFATLIAKLCGKKVVAYALDCGELKPYNQKLLRLLGNKIDLIIARTEDSKRRMEKFGIKKEVFVTTDPAFQYSPPGDEYVKSLLKKLNLSLDKPLVGIAGKEFFWFPIKPKLWGRREDFFHYPLYHTWAEEGRKNSRQVKEGLAKFADFCIESLDANVLLIAMERMDHLPSKDIYSLMKNKDRARVVDSNNYNLDDISGLLSKLKFLVSTRYHACVLSLVSSIPMITVSSDIRCEGLFRELGMMEFYVDYKTPDLYGALKEKSRLLLGNEGEIKEKIKRAYPEFLDRCLYNRVLFREWVERAFA